MVRPIFGNGNLKHGMIFIQFYVIENVIRTVTDYPTVIFSFGSFETFFCALDKAAKINVRPPTRPKNISRIKTLRESRFSSGVIPRDRPTVPTAEAVSKRQVSMGSPSETLMIRPPVQHSVIYISEIVAAFFTTSSSMRRPKRLAFSLRRKVEIAVVSKTAMVVVFKPPGGRPGTTADQHQRNGDKLSRLT